MYSKIPLFSVLSIVGYRVSTGELLRTTCKVVKRRGLRRKDGAMMVTRGRKGSSHGTK